MISAAIRGIFSAGSAAVARERLAEVLDRLAPLAPKVAQLLEDAEPELLAFHELPREHWSKLRSTNPLERVNREIGRRTDVVGIFPNDAALIRLAGSLLVEQNDEWLVSRRYLTWRRGQRPPREGTRVILGREQQGGARPPRRGPAGCKPQQSGAPARFRPAAPLARHRHSGPRAAGRCVARDGGAGPRVLFTWHTRAHTPMTTQAVVQRIG